MYSLGGPRAAPGHHVVPLVPGVVGPSEPEGERAAPVGERDAQRRGQAVERSAEDEGEEGQVRLGRHADEPLGHPAIQPRRGGHVPGVHEHRHPGLGAVRQELDDATPVEVRVPDVVADLDSPVPVGHASVELAAGGLRVLQRHLAERHESSRVVSGDLKGEVVEDRRHLGGLLRRPSVREEHGRGRDHLDVDPVVVHVGQASFGVPAGVADPPELARADHDRRLGGGVDAQRGPVGAADGLGQVGPSAGDVVRVGVDDRRRHAGGQPRPG